MSDQTEDVRNEDRKAREHEQAAKAHDPHERNPEATADPLDGDERKPAPPGPEAQQPRG